MSSRSRRRLPNVDLELATRPGIGNQVGGSSSAAGWWCIEYWRRWAGWARFGGDHRDGCPQRELGGSRLPHRQPVASRVWVRCVLHHDSRTGFVALVMRRTPSSLALTTRVTSPEKTTNPEAHHVPIGARTRARCHRLRTWENQHKIKQSRVGEALRATAEYARKQEGFGTGRWVRQRGTHAAVHVPLVSAP